MIIYKNHLLDSINDSRVIFELIKTTINDEKILVLNIDSDQNNFSTLINNIKYHNTEVQIISNDNFNIIKNYSNQKGLFFLCGKEKTLEACKDQSKFDIFKPQYRLLGLCC